MKPPETPASREAVSRDWMWIAWPAFLGACLLEMLVFAVVDPAELAWAGRPVDLSRQAAYTIAFFTFWAVTALACGLATVLRRPRIDASS